ncbi:uncharacterized protein LOC115133491 isoform X3 [Oncorhynchus nerka]|uniref:uncharacterized protein LOC115133491 isoform X3 n=1 Tax=Oncorhynchus nerka TaxID=8023 RepID=UPI0011322464|nr:uncharacterized protein LOC115133491 isoform X3 [Oncorhynchus nerka]
MVQASQRIRACVYLIYSHMFFVNATYLKIKGRCNGTISLVGEDDDIYLGEDDDGTMYLLPLVVILAVVTAVLLIVILILVLKIRRDANRHNTGPDPQRQQHNDQKQDPDTLNYAALNFTSKKRKLERRREKELDPHVVYAATR